MAESFEKLNRGDSYSKVESAKRVYLQEALINYLTAYFNENMDLNEVAVDRDEVGTWLFVHGLGIAFAEWFLLNRNSFQRFDGLASIYIEDPRKLLEAIVSEGLLEDKHGIQYTPSLEGCLKALKKEFTMHQDSEEKKKDAPVASGIRPSTRPPEGDEVEPLSEGVAVAVKKVMRA